MRERKKAVVLLKFINFPLANRKIHHLIVKVHEYSIEFSFIIDFTTVFYLLEAHELSAQLFCPSLSSHHLNPSAVIHKKWIILSFDKHIFIAEKICRMHI